MLKDLQDRFQRLQALSSLISGTVVGRAELSAKLGYQYGTDRDVYQALGYQDTITYSDVYGRYVRQDIARAIIDKPVEASWSGGVRIQEVDDKETQLEKAWDALLKDKSLALLPKLERLDKLAGIGRYAVLLLGFSDVKTEADFAKPVNLGTSLNSKKLLYVRPFGEGHAEIEEWETDTHSDRYDMPKTYKLTIANSDRNGSASTDLRVHWSRIIHVADNLLEGSVIGRSRLEEVYNRLMDLEKLVGGSAEMFWRGARPGYSGELDPDFSLTSEDESDLESELDEYEHNLRRILIMKGIKLQNLAPQVADPKPHVDVQIEMISAVTGIPKRILTGSERGELASTQDDDSWLTLMESRRTGWLQPAILRPVIDALILFGVLPKPATAEGYAFSWEPLFEKGEKEKAETGETRARAIDAYARNGMSQAIMPPEAFLEFCLGFDKDQVGIILEMQKKAQGTEEEEIEEDMSEEGVEESEVE